MNRSGLKHAADIQVGDVIETMDGTVEVLATEPLIRMVRREMVTFTLKHNDDPPVQRSFGLGATVRVKFEAKKTNQGGS